MKLFGAVLIVGSGLGFSWQMARYFKLQLLELQQWIELINLMISELEFTRRPLPQFFAELAAKRDRIYADFFRQCRAGLEESSSALYPVWKQCLLEYAVKSRLDDEGLMLLEELGKCLGKCDWETQRTALKLVLKKCEMLEKKISKQVNEKSKLWRYLGVLGSLILVIFLY